MGRRLAWSKAPDFESGNVGPNPTAPIISVTGVSMSGIFDFLKVLSGGCTHEWTPWGKPYVYGYSAYQRAKCTKCNQIITREVGSYNEDDDNPYL